MWIAVPPEYDRCSVLPSRLADGKRLRDPPDPPVSGLILTGSCRDRHRVPGAPIVQSPKRRHPIGSHHNRQIAVVDPVKERRGSDGGSLQERSAGSWACRLGYSMSECPCGTTTRFAVTSATPGTALTIATTPSAATDEETIPDTVTVPLCAFTSTGSSRYGSD